MTVLTDIDALVNSLRYKPRWGWHDDHRLNDGTPQYLPALQQVRREFGALLMVIVEIGKSGSALQLGLGECDASHDVWSALFRHVVTIDIKACLDSDQRYPGFDTLSREAADFARAYTPFEFLFLDACHDFEGVKQEYETYSPMVNSGGLIVFHDTALRSAYPELGVRRFVETLPVRYIGDEVGLAWMRKTA